MLVRKCSKKDLCSDRDFVRLQRRDRYRLAPRFVFLLLRFPLTDSLSDRPAMNATTLRAGILIFSPESGLRPSRARRCRTTKLPNGVSATRSPFCKADVISSKISSTMCDADRFEISASEATESTRSALVNGVNLSVRGKGGYTQPGLRLPIAAQISLLRAALVRMTHCQIRQCCPCTPER